MSELFRFKQFEINQDRCAMKIGTDGVLLGAWADIKNAESILDIGVGTGVIALMLAQRSNAEVIDAIEIDSNAYEQCVENFENSLWGDRLYCYHAGLDEFIEEIEDLYDVIVCNPPFYTESVTSGDLQRDQARQNEFLPFNELLEAVSVLISENGIFSTIIPFKEKDDFIRMAATFDLFPSRCLHVKGNPAAEVKRVLLEFTKLEKAYEVLDLTIEKERHVYTMDYIKLTKDFYLKM
ncbi:MULTISPECIES: tRNA1(Val) (adenine(37)-N6)-methyltransferase [Maribacter]|uniref:tRNA1(Val) (adenine(37)-N6)-methyltransferase n=2 Tax=Maribacter TaxID=252356 RepID=A0A1H7R9G4_9FLAO|nr:MULTISPECIES: methyltransferase [Maribacter]SEL56789.1 tRNA1Val (adenine37-N6)-methyltransferase [Maribacter orientalis]SKB41150.1 tRNA1Val (adenine37-N6)-methyltransferase [Maribacter arcticus]|tara:strand:- start:7 stop:717 length:711 start_codon:yes stop_codon:yes gene_type:complete